jgi:predicted dehydrogenase
MGAYQTQSAPFSPDPTKEMHADPWLDAEESLVLAHPPTKHKLPRIALFGVSGYGKAYLDLIRERKGGLAALQAACIVNRDEEENTWQELVGSGVRCYKAPEDLWRDLEGEIDLAILPTPPHTHAGLTVAALRAGANVLVEKPVATTTEDAIAMEQAAHDCGLRVFLGYQDMYLEQIWELKRRLVAGEFGRVLGINFLGLWPRPQSYYTRNRWAGKVSVEDQPLNDSPVSNAFSHYVNLSLFLAGKHVGSSAMAGVESARLWRANGVENFDTAEVVLRTEAGLPVGIYCSHACETDEPPRIRIFCEKDTLDWEFEAGVRSGSGSLLCKVPSVPASRRQMLEAVIELVAGGTRPHCSIGVAMAPLRVIEELSTWPVEWAPAERIVQSERPGGDRLMHIVGIKDQLQRGFEEPPVAYTRREESN